MVRHTAKDGASSNRVQDSGRKPTATRAAKKHRQHQQTKTQSVLLLLEMKLRNRNYSERAIKLITNAWRKGTTKTYSVYISRWLKYAGSKKNVSITSPTLQDVTDFLAELAQGGLLYSGMNTARSALSSVLDEIDGVPVGKHRLVCDLVKGVYNAAPPEPRYTQFWDVNPVFKLLLAWGNNEKMDLQRLTFKVTMLLFLVTSARGQTIANLPVRRLKVSDKLVFCMDSLLKHQRQGDPLETVVLEPYPDVPQLCVVETVLDYIIRTKDIRDPVEGHYLILSYDRPHKSVGVTTLGRYMSTVLELAGIDTEKFSLHSSRGATTSKAEQLGASAVQLMKHAHWKSIVSFAKHYRKDIQQDENPIPKMLLDNAVKKVKTQKRKANQAGRP